MRKLLIVMALCCVVLFDACSFWNSITSIFTPKCTKNVSDKYVFRASAEAMSSSLQMSQDKALADANRMMLTQVDEYIADKLSYKNFLRDDKYEQKIDSMRSKVLENAEISCSRVSQKSGNYIYSMTLQINKYSVDQIISEYK